jgi:hypothetical protein
MPTPRRQGEAETAPSDPRTFEIANTYDDMVDTRYCARHTRPLWCARR